MKKTSAVKRNGVLPPLRVRAGKEQPTRYRRFQAPPANIRAVLLRTLSWIGNGLRFGVWVGWQRLLGRSSLRIEARYLRQLLEKMGNAAIVAGRQIAMRIDILPLEYASELSLLTEQSAFFPLEQALQQVEAATRRPISECFQTFDPQPTYSDSVATFYQARLKGGQSVVVRVLHPQAAHLLNTEQKAVSVLIFLLAPILPTQFKILRHIREELAPILLEDLDFIRLARLQRWFRREIRRSRVDWINAARVYIRWTNSSVMISEFIRGVRLIEVIAAMENQDHTVLQELEKQGIHPKRIGQQLLHACWWSFFENDFFCEVPDANTIIITKEGCIRFTSLGDTGIIGWRKRRLFLTAMERMARHDVEGAVAMIIQLLLPLPYIDVYLFSKSMENRIWDVIFRMENPGSPWWERTGTGIWMAVFATTRDFGVSVNLDVVRMMQSACMYDHLAGQLWPEIRIFPEFKRYLRESTRRRAAHTLRTVRKTSSRALSANLLTRMRQNEGMLQRLNLWLEGVVENVPLTNLYTSRKSSYSMSQLLRAFVWIGQFSLAVILTCWVYLYFNGENSLIQDVFFWWIQSWMFLIIVLPTFIITARKIIYRLEEIDDNK